MTKAEVQRVALEFPELYGRIRSYCCWASKWVSLDEHAARVTLTVVNARKKSSQPLVSTRTAATGSDERSIA